MSLKAVPDRGAIASRVTSHEATISHHSIAYKQRNKLIMQEEALFDQDKFYLGSICKNNHQWGSTQGSLRYRCDYGCVECLRIKNKRNQQRRGKRKPESLYATNVRRNGKREKKPRQQEFYSYADLMTLLEKFENSCAYCGKILTVCPCCGNSSLTWDHLEPDGINGIKNMVPACRSCNSSKNRSNWLEWYKKREFYSLARERFIVLHQLQNCNMKPTNEV
ncbi:MAG TPA: hypothetical protein V6D33_12040 [Cyanophyceae cyanobacterium]